MALAADRNTPAKRKGVLAPFKLSTTTCYMGALVATTAAGLLVPASDTAGLVVRGRADKRGLSGETINVREGVFGWANGTSGEALSQTEIGEVVFVVDDQTVGKVGGTNNIKAGVLLEIDDDGVCWVKTMPSGGI